MAFWQFIDLMRRATRTQRDGEAAVSITLTFSSYKELDHIIAHLKHLDEVTDNRDRMG